MSSYAGAGWGQDVFVVVSVSWLTGLLSHAAALTAEAAATPTWPPAGDCVLPAYASAVPESRMAGPTAGDAASVFVFGHNHTQGGGGGVCGQAQTTPGTQSRAP